MAPTTLKPCKRWDPLHGGCNQIHCRTYTTGWMQDKIDTLIYTVCSKKTRTCGTIHNKLCKMLAPCNSSTQWCILYCVNQKHRTREMDSRSGQMTIIIIIITNFYYQTLTKPQASWSCHWGQYQHQHQKCRSECRQWSHWTQPDRGNSRTTHDHSTQYNIN